MVRAKRWEIEQTIGKNRLSEFISGETDAGAPFIKGRLKVLSENGASYGPFNLKILYPKNFPERGSVPAVYLESHRWKWKPGGDSHIENDWKLCLFIAATCEIDFLKEDSLDLLFDVVGSFLMKESLYQDDLKAQVITGVKARWFGPEYEHGIPGLRQALHETGTKLRRNDPCICGSGMKAKKCHYDQLWKLKS